MVEQTPADDHRKKETKTNDNSSRCSSVLFWFAMCALCRISTMLCQPTLANPVPPEDTLRVAELPFSEKIQNPCALVDASRLQTVTLSSDNEQERETTRRTVINEMKAKALLLRSTSETILRTNVLQDCSDLDLPSVAIIPSAEENSSNDPLDVLHLFYTSLMNHTAHVYFISEQLQRHSSDDSCNNSDLGPSAKSLASHMRELMCVQRLSIVAIQEQNGNRNSGDVDDTFDDPTSQILNEQLIDQPLCSRRSVRDCQTIRSTVTLLREFSRYLESTTFMGSEVSTSTVS